MPTIVLHGERDGVAGPEGSANDACFFTGGISEYFDGMLEHDDDVERILRHRGAVLAGSCISNVSYTPNLL
jgi:hypothetical protein